MNRSKWPFPTELRLLSGRRASNLLIFVLAGLWVLNWYGCATITAGRYVLDGDEYIDKGLYDEAISVYDKALAADPTSVAAYKGRGTAYSRKKQSDKALEDFLKAVEIDPIDTMALYYCGTIYVETGRDDEGIAYLTRAIELLETHPPGSFRGFYADGRRVYSVWDSFTIPKPYYSRGYAYHRQKQYEKANSDFTKAIQIHAGYTKAYLMRGSTYFDSGDRERACSDWKKACEMGECQLYHAVQKEDYCR
jgi:tetratricopeptide (TPR) repeat protein